MELYCYMYYATFTPQFRQNNAVTLNSVMRIGTSLPSDPITELCRGIWKLLHLCELPKPDKNTCPSSIREDAPYLYI